MRNILSLFLALSCLAAGQAQFKKDPILNLQTEDQKFLNWGYYLGFNHYDFKFLHFTYFSEPCEYFRQEN